jgi:hypothetical protein
VKARRPSAKEKKEEEEMGWLCTKGANDKK